MHRMNSVRKYDSKRKNRPVSTYSATEPSIPEHSALKTGRHRGDGSDLDYEYDQRTLDTHSKWERTLLLIVVFIALLLDWIHSSAIVAVMPDFLYRKWYVPLGGPDDRNQTERAPYLIGDQGYVGLLLGCKTLCQVLCTPLVGLWTQRIGYSIPLFLGLVTLCLSSFVFAVSETYWLWLLSRTAQGFGAACIANAGLGALAHVYADERERTAAMGIAMSGIAFGVIIGPIYGAVLYSLLNIKLPFFIIAVLAIIDAFFQSMIYSPKIEPPTEDSEGSMRAYATLVRDPYVLLVVGAIFLFNSVWSLLEVALPTYMMVAFDSSPVVQALVFLPISVLYIVSLKLGVSVAQHVGRWLVTLVCLVLVGAALLTMTMCYAVAWLLLPNAFIGLAIGVATMSMWPELAHIVDRRHSADMFSSVYALADCAGSVGYTLAPIVGGFMLTGMTFEIMALVMAVVVFVYAPIMLLQRGSTSQQRSNEQQALLHSAESVSHRTEDEYNKRRPPPRP